jgi:hypothetical protein
MVVAGRSAGLEGQRLRAQAAEHARVAAELEHQAGRWLLAAETEHRVANKLAVLDSQGYTFLNDRAWPGSRTGNIDHVLVGPGGVFIVDTKAWAEVSIDGGRILHGQADVTDDFAPLIAVGDGAAAALAEIGLSPNEVHVLIVLAGRDDPPTRAGGVVIMGENRAALYISRHGFRLTDEQVDAVRLVAETHFPELAGTQPPLDLTIRPVVVPESEPLPLLSLEEVTEVFLAGALAEPIESWMAFLHPTQAKLVRRSFNGPARIRGSAGTGKTVVGLHRAAYLARTQPQRVLVTSFVKTLPAVLSELVRRLAPESVDRIEFTGVHAFAIRLLKERRIHFHLDGTRADAAFAAAWRRVGLPGPLAGIDANQRYWAAEISKVIKGRGLTSFEQYATLPRTGRKRALNTEQRRDVWALFAEYENNLTREGIHDYDDVVLMAEASLIENPLEGYGAVIIDEAQDLTCAMVRMLHRLVGDAPDGLTVIGDGQQSIYPGGFTLAEAGISIAGRGVVMSTNYRNTKQIAEFASRTVEGDEFPDIDGDLQRADAMEVPRVGPAPVRERFRGKTDHDARVLGRLAELTCPRGDAAILCLRSRDVSEMLALLKRSGIPAIDLAEYAGTAVDAVKVGTVKRAKGLEFKTVLLPRVRPEWVEGRQHDDEALIIHRRELYVGMTRARDELWVGVCG